MGHHDLQNQPRPTREKEGDREVERKRKRERERETVGGREGRNCGGLSMCEMRFMRVGNKKNSFFL